MKTERQRMLGTLTRNELFSLRELKLKFKLTAQEVKDEVEHIFLTAKSQGYSVHIVPAECGSCKYVFKDRRKVSAPSRCPKCKSERVLEPLFKLIKND